MFGGAVVVGGLRVTSPWYREVSSKECVTNRVCDGEITGQHSPL